MKKCGATFAATLWFSLQCLFYLPLLLFLLRHPFRWPKHLSCTQRYKCRNRRTLIMKTPPSTATSTTTTSTCSSFKNSTHTHKRGFQSILWIKNRFQFYRVWWRVCVFTPFFLPSHTPLLLKLIRWRKRLAGMIHQILFESVVVLKVACLQYVQHSHAVLFT